jgi:CBS domain-containing protein
MPVGDYCRRSPCTAKPDETLRSAAERMEKEGVGLLVVVEDEGPVGVLSDRDVALAAVAERCDLAKARVSDAMSRRPVTILADDSISEAASRMMRNGVRRLPVVGDEGRVVGVIAADDLVRILAQEIGGLAGVVTAQLPSGFDQGVRVPAGRGAARPAEHYRRDVVSIRVDARVRELAEQMRDRAVGCVVAMVDADEPAGIVTDRDLALRVVARGLDPDTTSVAAVMSAPPITAQATQPVEEIVGIMRTRGVRRVPILSEGRLVGIVTFDDLLVAFGEELGQLGRATLRDVRKEWGLAQAERLRREAEERLRDLAGRLQRVGGETLRGVARELEALRERLRGPKD